MKPDTAQGTIALLNKRAPKSFAEFALLRRASSREETSQAIGTWKIISADKLSAAASAFAGTVSTPNPEEFSGESSDE
jgi:hypothetical protein